MRIISGTLKGRSLNFLKNSYTRPLKDSVKESIFNILKHSNFESLINSNIRFPLLREISLSEVNPPQATPIIFIYK